MMNVQGLRVTVFGMGKSGAATCRLLRARGAAVRASDVRPLDALGAIAGELDAAGIPFVPQGEAALQDCDLAVLSPGVNPALPLFASARSSGMTVSGDVEIAGRFLRGPVLGITGSNGKTTVTALCGHLLRECGIQAQVGGNIGRPLADMVDSSHDQQWNVLELSSFQLEMTVRFHVHIAVALNVTPDHLDRHGTFENYAAAKARIFANQTTRDFAVLNAENETTRAFARTTPARVFWFDAGARAEPGFWKSGDWLMAGGSAWMSAAEAPLRGRHNIENVLAGSCASHLAGAPLDALRQAVRSFPGVEHRLEFVRTRRGVSWYNDSKATNVDATVKALESFDKGLWVILGGQDKHSDYRPLIPLLRERARETLLIGAATEIIAGQFGDSVRLRRCGDLPSAINYAAANAQEGDTVVLAPACASFDQFNSYEHRGRVFKDLVHAMGE